MVKNHCPMQGFKLYMLREGVMPSTMKTRLTWIKRLSSVGPITASGFEKYLLEKLEAGANPNYLNSGIMSVRAWGKFTGNKRLMKVRLLKTVASNKLTLSDSEIEELLNLPPTPNCQKHVYQTYTDFFRTLSLTGMRPIEAASLTADDLDFGRGVILVRRSKTNTPRLVPIPPNLSKMLSERVRTCQKYLFPNKVGDKIQTNSYSSNFNRRLKRLGIKRKRLTCYSLRHSFITAMLEEDVSLFKVQKIVGHKRVETTAIYSHLTTKDIKEAILKHPRVRMARSPQERLEAYIEAGKDVVGDVFEIDVVHTKKGMKVEFKKKT